MRFSFIAFLSLFTFFSSLQAQEIKVLDQDSGEPLVNVAIYNLNKTKNSITNLQGKADVSMFKLNEMLVFKHISHLEKRMLKSQIGANRSVFLKEDENMLQEVVLSVAKFKQEKKDIPQRIVSLSSEDIAFSNAQTSADLMESSGNVYVQKSQLGGGSPMIRGFATNRLLIAVDGVRMNTAIFRSGNIQNIISIDPLAVERAEIILGPGSVVYGSDAIGGVMNFYTLKPTFALNGKTDFSANAYTRYATANEEKTAHIDFNVGFEKWAFLSSVTYSDFEDLTMGSHGPDEFLRTEFVRRIDGEDRVMANTNPRTQVPTGYDQINLLQKVAYMPNETWNFSLGLVYSETSDYSRYDRLFQKRKGKLRYAEWYYGPQSWFLGNLNVNKVGNGALYDNLQFTGAYQNFEESRYDRKFGNETLYVNTEIVDAYSANMDFEKGFGRNKLFYGVEYVLNTVNSTGDSKNIITGEEGRNNSRYPDGSSWQSLAAYSSFNWKINNDLNLQSGLRYNHIIINADFPQTTYDFPFNNANMNTGALTGSTGLSWQQNENTEWKVNLSTAFRAPNIDDVGKIFDSEPGAVVTPNPNLKPEYAYNAEIGLKKNVFDIFTFDVAAFYTYLDNALVRRDYKLNGSATIEYQGEQNKVQAIQNAASAYVYGFEGGMDVRLHQNLKMASQITITKGKEEQDDGKKAPLRHAAPLYGNTHLIWSLNRLKFDLYSEYNGKLDFDELAPSEQEKTYLYALDSNGNPYFADWYALNITAQYQFSPNWVATLVLENITDQRYRTYSSGISAAGRNLIIALRYSL